MRVTPLYFLLPASCFLLTTHHSRFHTHILLTCVSLQSADGGGVHRVEGEARRREAAAIPTMAEMLERTPEIETPAYAVLASHEAEGWEVRSQRVVLQ